MAAPSAPTGKITVAVDLDEVLGAFVDALALFHNEKYGTALKVADFCSYHFSDVWGGTPEETSDKMNAFFESTQFADIAPLKDASYVLRQNAEAFRYVVITSRQHVLEDRTRAWLERHFPGVFAGVHFGNHYGAAGVKKTKSQLCEEVGAEILIDDSPAYAREAAPAVDLVLLFGAYPWNGHAKVEGEAAAAAPAAVVTAGEGAPADASGQPGAGGDGTSDADAAMAAAAAATDGPEAATAPPATPEQQPAPATSTDAAESTAPHSATSPSAAAAAALAADPSRAWLQFNAEDALPGNVVRVVNWRHVSVLLQRIRTRTLYSGAYPATGASHQFYGGGAVRNYGQGDEHHGGKVVVVLAADAAAADSAAPAAADDDVAAAAPVSEAAPTSDGEVGADAPSCSAADAIATTSAAGAGGPDGAPTAPTSSSSSNGASASQGADAAADATAAPPVRGVGKRGRVQLPRRDAINLSSTGPDHHTGGRGGGHRGGSGSGGPAFFAAEAVRKEWEVQPSISLTAVGCDTALAVETACILVAVGEGLVSYMRTGADAAPPGHARPPRITVTLHRSPAFLLRRFIPSPQQPQAQRQLLPPPQQQQQPGAQAAPLRWQGAGNGAGEESKTGGGGMRRLRTGLPHGVVVSMPVQGGAGRGVGGAQPSSEDAAAGAQGGDGGSSAAPNAPADASEAAGGAAENDDANGSGSGAGPRTRSAGAGGLGSAQTGEEAGVSASADEPLQEGGAETADVVAGGEGSAAAAAPSSDAADAAAVGGLASLSVGRDGGTGPAVE